MVFETIMIKDNSLNKYSNYMATIFVPNEDVKKLIPDLVREAFESVSDKYVFQLEKCPTTGNIHYQCCLVTRIRKRHRTLLNELSVSLQIDPKYITIDRMQGSWDQAKEYCTKNDTRVKEDGYDKPFLSRDLAAAEVMRYKGKDLEVFKTKGFFLWQEKINNIIFKNGTSDFNSSSCREVFWVEDTRGNSGKSPFTKYLCYNYPEITKLAFGSGSQMRSAIIEEGPKKCYIIDIPRKLCNDDFQNNIYSCIEDIKNGFVKSSMYGQPKSLFMEPPQVIIFSNYECPIDKLSMDRWRIYSIIEGDLVELVDERIL
jgi:hypothetical protein